MPVSTDPNDPNFGLETDVNSPNFGLPGTATAVAEPATKEPSLLKRTADVAGQILGATQRAQMAVLTGGGSELQELITPKPVTRFMRTGLVSPETITPVVSRLNKPARTMMSTIFGETGREASQISEEAIGGLLSSFTSPEGIAMAVGPAAIGKVGRLGEVLGFRKPTVKPVTEEVIPPNAKQDITTTSADGDVLNQPRPQESTGQMPAQISSEGVPPRGQGETLSEGEVTTAPEVKPVPEGGEAPVVSTQPKEASAGAGGAAVPPEAVKPTEVVAAEEPGRLTSTKNDVVDVERQARGLEPVMAEVKTSHPEIMAQAEAKLTENPSYGKVLVKDLVDGTKNEISKSDEAILLREKIATQNAKDAAAKRATNEKLSESERAQAKQEFDELEEHNNNIDIATHRSGEIWGEFGRFRQRLAAEDYSLEAIEGRWRMAKGNKPLTLEESQSIKKDTAKLSDLQSKIDKRREFLEGRVAQEKGLAEKPVRGKTEQPVDTEIEALQTELATLKAAQKEANRLPAAKERTQKRIDELNKRMEEIGFQRPPKRIPVEADKELDDLLFEYSKTKEALDVGIYEAQLKSAPLPKRIWQTTREILSLPRAFLASGEFSGVRRQGGLYTMAHPISAIKAFKAMLKATPTERGYHDVMRGIREDANFREAMKAGLEITDINPLNRAQMEEMYQSRWAKNIPIVKQSQQAYVAFLNKARMDWYNILKQTLGRDGAITPDQSKVIANAINVFTGRGSFSGKWQNALTAMNDVFFAPKWRFSRLQTLALQPLWKGAGSMAGTGTARALIAGEYAKFLVGYGAILSMAGYAASGVFGNKSSDIESSPLSTDFGKIKIGNTRIDFLNGLQQHFVFMSRLLSGKSKTQKGEVKSIYGDVPFGATTASDLMKNYIRTSLAPVPTTVVNLLEGRNVVGEPTTPASIAKGVAVPLTYNDIYEAMKDQGISAGAAMGLLAVFGDGLQTYDPKVAKAFKKPSRRSTARNTERISR